MSYAQKNTYSGYKVEFHVLQSFPVTCLNRDDAGEPKTAQIGGNTRARVSSQCWKRAVRLYLHILGLILGVRTQLISKMIQKECLKQGSTEDQAIACGNKIEKAFIKEKKDKKEGIEGSDDTKDKSDTLLFFSPSEVTAVVNAFRENEFDPDKTIKQSDAKKSAKEIAKIIGKPNFNVDGRDIALFGRMVAQAASLNVEAAASFSHAISTHRITNEIDFFTALDDEKDDEETGSAHMNFLEFNSATYYRYISLDLGQLYENMAGTCLPETVEILIKALFLALPQARQATQSGACPWEYARVYIRKGQRLQASFETGIKAKNGGFLESSKEFLCKWLYKQEKQWGSLFGKVASFTYGEDETYSIDSLITDILETIKKV